MRYLVCLGCVVSSLNATEKTITSLADAGFGVLRECLMSAEDGDIYTFQPGLSGTILLQSDLPEVSTSIMIQGQEDATVTIDGASQYQIFTFTGGISRVSNLTLVNESSGLGGAIWIEPNVIVSIDHLLIDSNQAPNSFSSICIEPEAELQVLNTSLYNSAFDFPGTCISETIALVYLTVIKTQRPWLKEWEYPFFEKGARGNFC